jgi:hypothetical protein
MTERPEDYNDHSEEYDRELYDTYFGEGMHDRVMQYGTYENKVMMFEKIRELWNDIDSGAVARVAELNDKLKKSQSRVTSLVAKNKVQEAEAEAIDKLIFRKHFSLLLFRLHHMLFCPRRN